MVLEGLGLPVFGRCDQFPNETLDLLVSLIMLDTVHQEGTANHLHVLLVQMPFESAMSQDVLPPAPAKDEQVLLYPEALRSEVAPGFVIEAPGSRRPFI